MDTQPEKLNINIKEDHETIKKTEAVRHIVEQLKHYQWLSISAITLIAAQTALTIEYPKLSAAMGIIIIAGMAITLSKKMQYKQRLQQKYNVR